MKRLKLLSWRRWRLQTKLIFLYIPLIVFPTMLGFYFFTSAYNTSNRNTATTYSQSVIQYMSEKIDSQLSHYETVSRQIFDDPELQQLLTQAPKTQYEIMNHKNQLNNRLDILVTTSDRKYIRAIVFLTPIGHYVYGEEADYKDQQPEFLSTISNNGGSVEWFPPLQFQSISKTFTAFRLARSIRNFDLKEIGKMYMVIDAKLLQDIFNESKLSKEAAIQIISENDSHKQIIVSNNKPEFGQGRKPIIIENALIHNEWSLAASLPLDELYTTISKMTQLAVLITLICIAMALLATYFIVIDVILPIKKLMQNMRLGIKGRNPSSLIKFRGAREIIELNDTYISLMYEIYNLIGEVVKNQAKKREAEIKLLQNQISPHFLYNTLNSIRWMALIQKQDNIKEMVDSLTKLLSYSIRNTDELVTIGEEIDVLKDYAKIQKVRYQDFIFATEIEEGLESVYTLKFLIQPLIENALLHGLSSINWTGIIHLKVRRDSDVLLIQVMDNGIGMDEDTLENLQSNLKQKSGMRESKHIGLTNIHERVRLHFGERFGIKISSEYKKGTSVNLYLPLISTIEERDFSYENGNDR
ncbi:hypothetical protein A8709_32710 [Paenibacillus pectinilyticus]|uniref:Histidine kinase domain-containing protein n=1 Tax=Paenibacillus pectinilyticus TaxID=512399 RepID=A0A1C0ZWW0_9BACL|nr:sensor histidine kinase [Paenibacillus pectinilyticus]OCT12579.1 hypothetical protein A8709_32710 [Paenibacillus pectinilyticus]